MTGEAHVAADRHLDTITALLVIPFLEHVTYYNLMIGMLMVMVYKFGLNTTPSHVALYLLIPFVLILAKIFFPITYDIGLRTIKKIEKQFIDDNYLIGKRLVNKVK